MVVQLIMGWRHALSFQSANTDRRPYLGHFEQDVQYFTPKQTTVILPHLSVHLSRLGIPFFRSHVLAKSLTRPH